MRVRACVRACAYCANDHVCIRAWVISVSWFTRRASTFHTFVYNLPDKTYCYLSQRKKNLYVNASLQFCHIDISTACMAIITVHLPFVSVAR